ncbi:MAG: sigma-70 family RNA polymerase sigma factor [Algibacter sp.]
MELNTHTIWNEYNTEIFFFILKRVKNKDSANEIVQNSFVKIHINLKSLKQVSKVKSWIFQIVRNEIVNFYNQNETISKNYSLKNNPILPQVKNDNLCCFDRFINELPEKYKVVIEKIYFESKKSLDVAQELDISLANVKARVRRAKNILKLKLTTCCKFYFDKNGKLIGESNCSVCN